MLTLSFIHNFAPKKKVKPKTMDRKKKKHSQENYPVHLLLGSNFQAKKHLPEKALWQKFSAKKVCTEEIMSVSAVPNEESNK